MGLKKLRVQKGISLNKFAVYVGITHTTLAKYEGNDRERLLRRLEDARLLVNSRPFTINGALTFFRASPRNFEDLKLAEQMLIWLDFDTNCEDPISPLISALEEPD